MTKRSAQDHAWFPLGLGFAALALLVGVLGVWSVKARIAGAVIASGMIQLENNRQVVQHPQGGVVGEILVKNGDTVVAGQVLLRLDDTIMKSELTIVEGQLFEIHARKARLEAERDGMARMTVPKALAEVVRQHPEVQSMIDGHRRLFDARLESMRRESDQILEQIDQGHNQIAGTSAQLAAFQTQQDLIFKAQFALAMHSPMQ